MIRPQKDGTRDFIVLIRTDTSEVLRRGLHVRHASAPSVVQMPRNDPLLVQLPFSIARAKCRWVDLLPKYSAFYRLESLTVLLVT